MEAEVYIKILDANLPLSVQNLDLGLRFTFQQDSNMKHTSKSVTWWLQNNNITGLP